MPAKLLLRQFRGKNSHVFLMLPYKNMKNKRPTGLHYFTPYNKAFNQLLVSGCLDSDWEWRRQEGGWGNMRRGRGIKSTLRCNERHRQLTIEGLAVFIIAKDSCWSLSPLAAMQAWKKKQFQPHQFGGSLVLFYYLIWRSAVRQTWKMNRNMILLSSNFIFKNMNTVNNNSCTSFCNLPVTNLASDFWCHCLSNWS